jgi:hypothetical protein
MRWPARGARLSVAPAQATRATIARLVDTLLGDATLRAGAQRVAAESRDRARTRTGGD